MGSRSCRARNRLTDHLHEAVNTGRLADLRAALGDDRLAVLMEQFRSELSGLYSVIMSGGATAAVLATLHRLRGSGATLGLDGVAASLFATERDCAGSASTLLAGLDRAEVVRAATWVTLAPDLPGLAHERGAAKR